MKYSSKVDKRPGTEVARGRKTSYNVITVIEKKRVTVYSLQCGKWKKA